MANAISRVQYLGCNIYDAISRVHYLGLTMVDDTLRSLKKKVSDILTPGKQLIYNAVGILQSFKALGKVGRW